MKYAFFRLISQLIYKMDSFYLFIFVISCLIILPEIFNKKTFFFFPFVMGYQLTRFFNGWGVQLFHATSWQNSCSFSMHVAKMVDCFVDNFQNMWFIVHAIISLKIENSCFFSPWCVAEILNFFAVDFWFFFPQFIV